MRGLWALACLVPAWAAAEALPDEVRIASVGAARAVCDDIAAGGRRRDDAIQRVYVVSVGPTGFGFVPYDARRARLMMDLSSFQGPGGLDLVLYDIVGPAPPGALDLSIPATADEGADLLRAHRGGKLALELWFRAPADGRTVCAPIHRAASDGLRMAIEPLAFELRQGTQRVASGETAEFAALRAQNGPVIEPRVVVGALLLAVTRGRAPAALSRAASVLEHDLTVCYRRGLAADPFLRGPLALGVDIAADGRVASVRAEIDGIGVPEVVSCAMVAVKNARFPRGAARVSIPLRFTD